MNSSNSILWIQAAILFIQVAVTCFYTWLVYHQSKLLSQSYWESSSPKIIFYWADYNTMYLVNIGRGPAYNICVKSPALQLLKKVLFPLFPNNYGTIKMIQTEEKVLQVIKQDESPSVIEYDDKNGKHYREEIPENNNMDPDRDVKIFPTSDPVFEITITKGLLGQM